MVSEAAASQTGTATILFTDLVDSTGLRVRIGEDAAEALRRVHDRLLADAVARHNGTLVKGLGDGIMATFGAAADAVAAAVAIQQAVDTHNRRMPQRHLGIRVGMSVGDVVWEKGDCFGTSVIEAARLCEAAQSGQILAAELVRLLTRGRGGYRFGPVGELSLKGLAEPVVACEVSWEPVAQTEIPRPPRLGVGAALSFVGRSAEQEALALAWAKARDGQRQVVLVSGEPGIGKTRLATEMALAAHADGATVLLGTCDEHMGVPYRPFVEALQHYVTHAPLAVLAAHTEQYRGELVRLVPELARRVGDLPAPQDAQAETQRYLMFEAATGLLAAASQRGPVVLVLEDLHWAAAPELLLLKHVVRSAEPMRLLVIGTYRDTELSRNDPLTEVLADLRREPGVDRLALQGLDDEAVVALVTAAAGHELSDAGVELAHSLRRDAEGNPFFITEILRRLVETGMLVRDGGRWRYTGDIAGLAIPESVREVIGRRLDRLSEATRRLLGQAAVIGRQFDLALLARVAETTEDAILDALDEAGEAALVTELPGAMGQFTFSHTLIRTTLYEDMGATRRSRLHRRVGEVLEDLAADHPAASERVDQLAYHWLAATQAADAEKAVAYARRAGDRALVGLAFEEAAVHYERALTILAPRGRDDEVLRCDLLLARGDAQRRAGDARYQETVAEAAGAARALADPERLALAALGSARPGGWMARGNIVDATLIALYEEAIAALGDGDSLLRARLFGQLAVELVYTHERERRDALSRDAIEIAERIGDRAGLAHVLVLRLIAMNDPYTLTERLALTARLAALAEELGSIDLAYHAALHRTGALFESGDIDGAERGLADVERRAGELRQPFYSWFALMGRAMLAIMRGAADGEAQAFRAFEVGTAGGQPGAPPGFGAQLALIRYDQGRLGELVGPVQANVEAMPHIPAWRAALAMFYCETDRVAEAREQIDTIRETGLDAPLNWTWTAYMVNLCRVAEYLHDRELAAWVYERLLPIAEQMDMIIVVVVSTGSCALPCGILAGVLGRWDEAERHFERALAMNARFGARASVVRTQRAYGAMLLERDRPGDPERAARLIAAALTEADVLGMTRETVRLRELETRLAAEAGSPAR